MSEVFWNQGIMREVTLEDRIRGCLIGSAVGDALGAPCECLHYREIPDVFGMRGMHGKE
jgi:ADP-ribosylglycohydrolase